MISGEVAVVRLLFLAIFLPFHCNSRKRGTDRAMWNGGVDNLFRDPL